MGVGMGIAGRWMDILGRGGPIPLFYVMGGSLVFVFLTWHIPSVAGSMMAGAVSLSLADAVYPAIWGSRAAGAGVIAAGAAGGAAVGAGRWVVDHLRVHTLLHTGTRELPPAQTSAATVSTPPPPEAGRAESLGKAEPRRPKSSPTASGTRDLGGSTGDRGAPRGAEGQEQPRGDSHPG